MSKYRVIEYKYPDKTFYIAQERFLRFFWLNFVDHEGDSIKFESLEEAKKRIETDRNFFCIRKIIEL